MRAGLRRNSNVFIVVVILTMLVSLTGLDSFRGFNAPLTAHAQQGGRGVYIPPFGWNYTVSQGDPIDDTEGEGCFDNYGNQWGIGSSPSSDPNSNYRWAWIDADGNLKGGCHIFEWGGDNQNGYSSLIQGTVSGKFTEASNSISDFQIETSTTYTFTDKGVVTQSTFALVVDGGSGGPVATAESGVTHRVTGKFTESFVASDGTTSTTSGSVSIPLEISGPSGPSIQLDRTKAARFSALLVSGAGLKPNAQVDIVWEGKKLFDVKRTNEKGNIPDDTWIWVPDDAAFGVNKVWAEQGDVKTNQVEVEVYQVNYQQLVDNIDIIVAQYLQKIPPNAFGYTSGARWNAAWTFGWLTGVTDGRFRCGWYQGEVLNFFEDIRFDRNIENRARLDGLDYGPLFSGLTTSSLQHAFVAVWPHGAAITPGTSVSEATYESAGIAFDPWQKQKPELYAVKSGSADWADGSIYSPRWKFGSQNLYILPTANNEADPMYNGIYPVTGASYYQSVRHRIAEEITRADNTYGQPNKAMAVQSPVRVEITDPQGKKLVTQDDGFYSNEIAGAEVISVTESDGGYAWIITLPEGNMDVNVIGTGDGSYQLVTRNRNQPMYEYPPVPVTAGATSAISLDDGSKAAPLRTSDGKELLPTVRPSPWDEEASPAMGLPAVGNTTIIIVGVAGCGLAGFLVVVVGAVVLIWRRKTKVARPRAAAPQPVYPAPRYPPPQAARPPARYAPPQAAQPQYPARQAAPPLQDGQPIVRPSYSVSRSLNPTPARLVVAHGTGSRPLISIPPEGLTIGRDKANLLSLDDTKVSRRHARIEFGNGVWFITDLNSANGTFVNGCEVRRQALDHGDHILVGQTELVFHIVP